VGEKGAVTSASEVKGLWFVALQQYLRDAHGDAELERVAEAMPARYRAVLRAPLTSSWYPEEALQSALSAAYASTARANDQDFMALIEGVTEHGISRFFRVLLRMATPEFVLKQVPAMWRHGRRGLGTVTVSVLPKVVTVSYAEFPYFDDRRYRLLTEAMLRTLVRVGSKRPAHVRIDDHGVDWLRVKVEFSSEAWSPLGT
jgi:hypothetical protein